MQVPSLLTLIIILYGLQTNKLVISAVWPYRCTWDSTSISDGWNVTLKTPHFYLLFWKFLPLNLPNFAFELVLEFEFHCFYWINICRCKEGTSLLKYSIHSVQVCLLDLRISIRHWHGYMEYDISFEGYYILPIHAETYKAVRRLLHGWFIFWQFNNKMELAAISAYVSREEVLGIEEIRFPPSSQMLI